MAESCDHWLVTIETTHPMYTGHASHPVQVTIYSRDTLARTLLDLRDYLAAAARDKGWPSHITYHTVRGASQVPHLSLEELHASGIVWLENLNPNRD